MATQATPLSSPPIPPSDIKALMRKKDELDQEMKRKNAEAIELERMIQEVKESKLLSTQVKEGASLLKTYRLPASTVLLTYRIHKMELKRNVHATIGGVIMKAIEMYATRFENLTHLTEEEIKQIMELGQKVSEGRSKKKKA
jgi:imidazolonepropionase-like amidohydrolase